MGIFQPFVAPLDIDKIESRSSAELYEHAWNTSLYHLLTKSVGGLTIGLGLSLILFKRKPWPIAFCTGAGLGMAYTEANYIFWYVEKKLAVTRPNKQSVPS